MFHSDKDLNRFPPKKTGTSKLKKAEDKDEILERTRKEREQRKALRESSVHVLKIQSWWRGRHYGSLWIQSQKSDFDKKLDDIQKLAAVLKATKAIDFVPPTTVCLELARKLVIGTFSPSTDVRRLLRFCELILFTTLVQPDPTKNLAQAFLAYDPNSYIIQKLVKNIFNSLHPKTFKKSKQLLLETDIIFLSSLMLLLGYGEPFKMKFTEELKQTFRSIRFLLTNKLKNQKTNHIGLFQNIYNLLYSRSEMSYLCINNDNLHANNGQSRPPVGSTADLCLDLSIFLIEADEDKISDRLGEFSREIFACPVSIAQLSNDAVRRLCRWKHFESLLDLFSSTTNLALPPSPNPAFLSGQWLLGNVCSLATFLDILPSTTTSHDDDDRDHVLISSLLLKKYLNICTSLISRYTIPGIFSGRPGVLWSRVGAQLVAAGVPSTLSHQVLTLLDPKLLTALVSRILAPLATDLNGLGSTEDVKNIRDALTNSGDAMAQQAAKVATSDGSWFGAKWAKKLINSVSSAFTTSITNSSSTSQSQSQTKVSASFIASSMTETTEIPMSEFPVDMLLVISLSELWGLLLPPAASAPVESIPWKSLSVLCFSPQVISLLWTARLALGGVEAERVGYRSATSSSTSPPPTSTSTTSSSSLSLLYRGGGAGASRENETVIPAAAAVLVCLCACLKIALVVLDETELYDQGKPLPLQHLLPLICTLKNKLYNSMKTEPSILLMDPNVDPNSCSADPLISQDRSLAMKQQQTNQRVFELRCIVAVLANLHSRWARRPFSSREVWEVEEANTTASLRELKELSSTFTKSLFRTMPWDIMHAERVSIQGDSSNFMAERSRGTVVRIRRAQTMLLHDGMKALEHVSAAGLKDRIVVRYIDEFGQEEAGIDAGGLFKDFWTALASAAFDPSFGLFALTPDQLLYPSPSAPMIFGSDCDKMFHFLGRVLGKALYEDLTVQPRFAHFFLSFMQGKYSYLNLVHDLASMDAELHKNLLFLKSYEGDIGDLCLTFSVTEDCLGGSMTAVTSTNRHRYISAAANYYLHDRLKNQAQAFFSGLHEVVSPDLLSMFCAPELQVLLSGSSSGVALDELKQHVRYTAGYFTGDVYTGRFWTVMSQLSETDRAAVIRFVTACERPPCLGWSALQPPFTIQRVDCSDDSRLPTSSTCFNVLKLPTYSSQHVLKEKLLLAVRNAGGFNLS
eukprot:gene5961-12031_t